MKQGVAAEPVPATTPCTPNPGSDVRGLLPEQLAELVACHGLPAYRAEQVLRWVHSGAADYEQMTNLSRADRHLLQREFPLPPMQLAEEQASADGATKFLWRLADGELIESVALPGTRGRGTVCISTQVGCPLGCRFCATAAGGFTRNLSAGEIVGQVLAMRSRGCRFTNVVMMGMGEPLLNYDAVLQAAKVMNWDAGLAIGRRRITISTAGIVPGIKRLAREDFRVRLAVSLNGCDTDVRRRLMPVDDQYPLAEVIAACREYSEVTGWWLTFEYVLIGGVNDSRADADCLARLTDGILRKVNVIVCNGGPDVSLTPPSRERVDAFVEQLRARGVSTTLRRSQGADIQAACGQLRGRS